MRKMGIRGSFFTDEGENMGFFELFFIGIGLSMDAFAVSVCKGLKMRKVNKKQAFIIGLFFGGFQALMPLAGWLLGTRFSAYIVCSSGADWRKYGQGGFQRRGRAGG